jgi:hypothetical protein
MLYDNINRILSKHQIRFYLNSNLLHAKNISIKHNNL